ncbi:MAG: hypothetical protein NC110_04430, partial [Ruminococcus sp.]|nr:hypothetical protein [Ruminococcus sp.]
MKSVKSIMKALAIIVILISVVTLPLRLPVLGMMLTNNSFSREKYVININIDAFEDTAKWVPT